LKREHVWFLLCGVAFGFLVGYGLFQATHDMPRLALAAGSESPVPGPQGPAAPTQVADAGGGAPMVAEINRLKQKLQENPEDGETLVRLAHLYHDASMWQQAVDYYERALELSPHDPDLLTDAGICYRGMQEFDRALESFDRAHRADPRHWQALFNTVVVATFDVGRFDLAVEALDAIEAMDPIPAELDPARLVQLREALERARAAHPESGQS
jgi:tetratricopeptide (TPR) repeat protein